MPAFSDTQAHTAIPLKAAKDMMLWPLWFGEGQVWASWLPVYELLVFLGLRSLTEYLVQLLLVPAELKAGHRSGPAAPWDQLFKELYPHLPLTLTTTWK